MGREWKKLWNSKTFWYGFSVVAGAMLDAAVSGLEWRQVVMAGVGAGIVVLRMWTDQPVRVRKPKKLPGNPPV